MVRLDKTSLPPFPLNKVDEMSIKEAGNLETGVNLVAELDCILSMSIISLENNWKKPVLAEDGSLGIYIWDGFQNEHHNMGESTTHIPPPPQKKLEIKKPVNFIKMCQLLICIHVDIHYTSCTFFTFV